MSRSYRRPYGTYSNFHNSAHADKTMAARGVRRKQNAWLRSHWDDDGGLIPHRRECGHNNVYAWIRDGSQFFIQLTGNDWRRHLEAMAGTQDRNYMTWPPVWYQDLIRK